jgi:hypothetical protein
MAQDVLNHLLKSPEAAKAGLAPQGLGKEISLTNKKTETGFVATRVPFHKETNMGGRKKTLVGMAALMLLTAPLALRSWAAGDGGPDTVEIGSLANHYSAVTFDHATHTGLASSCAECHHHTTGLAPVDSNCARCHEAGSTARSVACKDCHSDKRFSAEDLAKTGGNPQLHHKGTPGLKGAYHQKCLGCHTAMGGPTGCQDCHTRNDKGDAFFNAGKYAPAPAAAGGHGGGH